MHGEPVVHAAYGIHMTLGMPTAKEAMVGFLFLRFDIFCIFAFLNWTGDVGNTGQPPQADISRNERRNPIPARHPVVAWYDFACFAFLCLACCHRILQGGQHGTPTKPIETHQAESVSCKWATIV